MVYKCTSGQNVAFSLQFMQNLYFAFRELQQKIVHVICKSSSKCLCTIFMRMTCNVSYLYYPTHSRCPS